VLFSADGPDRNVLKFKPPMCFNTENADELLDKIDAILSEIEDGEVDTTPEKLAKLMHGSANGPASATKNGSQNGKENIKT
jgi:hypothetical protein